MEASSCLIPLIQNSVEQLPSHSRSQQHRGYGQACAHTQEASSQQTFWTSRNSEPCASLDTLPVHAPFKSHGSKREANFQSRHEQSALPWLLQHLCSLMPPVHTAYPLPVHMHGLACVTSPSNHHHHLHTIRLHGSRHIGVSSGLFLISAIPTLLKLS